MEPRLQRYVTEHKLLLPPQRAVVGVSGGVDSVVLFRLLLAFGIDLHVVHVNYHLREEAADADEAFVRRLCDALDVPLTVRQQPIGQEARQQGRSVQEAARRARYRIFEEVALEAGISRVAVGHQMDDQIETIILQLARGTGLRGLAGMPRRRSIRRDSSVEIIRPLLFARRAEIETYARRKAWDWRVDRSNSSTKYLRTALRREVLPALEEHVGPGGVENIARTADLIREYLETEWNPRLQEDLERAVDRTDDGVIRIALEVLQEVSRIWRQELLLEVVRRYLPEVPVTEAIAEELADLVDAQVGRRKEYATHTVWRGRERLFVVPEARGQQTANQRLEVGDTITLPGQGQLSLDVVDDSPGDPVTTGAYVALIDADCVRVPFRVRPWRAGDRLQPLGMEGHKKVSDLLTEAKVPPHHRDQVHVVTSNDTIVWVVGYRLAHPVRVTRATKRVFKLSLVDIS